MFVCEKRSTRDNFKAGVLTTCDDLASGFPLHGHCANKYTVGPCQVFFSELGYIDVNQAFRPTAGHHGRHRQKT